MIVGQGIAVESGAILFDSSEAKPIDQSFMAPLERRARCGAQALRAVTQGPKEKAKKIPESDELRGLLNNQTKLFYTLEVFAGAGIDFNALTDIDEQWN